MGDILSAAGSIAGGAMNASAIRSATNAQIAALQQAQQFVYNELDPTVIGGYALGADAERAKNRLALQAQIDPALSQLRFDASGNLLRQTNAIGTGIQEQVGQQAAIEALNNGASTNDLRDRLIDAAKQELDAGATLPPDLQAELVQTGLEKAGMVSGAASPKGFGGTLVRKELGKAAITLQQQRQQQAAALAGTASSLEGQRQAILGSLFPSLNNMQLSNLAATNAALGTANQMVPEAGLGGNDIANIWLARVGATNQLNQSAADAAARGTMGVAQAWAPAVGQGAQALANNAGSAWNTVRGWFSSPSSGGSSGDFANET